MSLLHPVNTSWCLEQICESNFQKLLRLIPGLPGFEKPAIGKTAQNPALYLDIVDRSPYTLTIELSHCFSQPGEAIMQPAVTIRLYLDVQLAEVIRDHERPSVDRIYPNAGKCLEIQEYKWRLNYFLQKWLDHCLQNQYCFSSAEGLLV